MSATILASLIANNSLSGSNEDVMIEKSVKLAIKLANLSEKLVKSDQEWIKTNTANSFLGG